MSCIVSIEVVHIILQSLASVCFRFEKELGNNLLNSVMEFEWVFAPFDTLFIHLTQHLKIMVTWGPTMFVSLVNKIFLSHIIMIYGTVKHFESESESNSQIFSPHIMGMMSHFYPLKLVASSITVSIIILWAHL